MYQRSKASTAATGPAVCPRPVTPLEAVTPPPATAAEDASEPRPLEAVTPPPATAAEAVTPPPATAAEDASETPSSPAIAITKYKRRRLEEAFWDDKKWGTGTIALEIAEMLGYKPRGQ